MTLKHVMLYIRLAGLRCLGNTIDFIHKPLAHRISKSSTFTSIIAITLIGAAAAAPFNTITKREVPQEHAHENVLSNVQTSLELNNPDKISNTVFGLLGAKAAAEGAGNIKDTDCLQQATADQAFTNAKAANDVTGMTMAMIYRALERNTGSVGLASAACKSIKAVNPEIAALQQHQDPASDGAAALNKQIATTLATQIAAIGGDVSLANEASTFAPGKIGDPTGAGNTCDDAKDAAGCINTLKLRVDDLSAAELSAISAKGGAAAAGAATAGAASNGTAAAGGQGR
ncbi:cell wall manno [Pyrenophora seminiperda CCB06]|uniref:Cell wall manno n=1 Tax=Pyrenophora seminiperda CCB06 TaxID=1302712 RepID=A0A3M7MGP1_9PLEO|nr:cell wall manno [Pyrenophora seminiperda CCB06]